MQEAFTIVINGPDCVEKKQEIDKAAKELHMSRTGFMLWLYEQFVKRQERKTNAIAR